MLGREVSPKLRLLFDSILRSADKYQISSGQLEDCQTLVITLAACLDFVEDSLQAFDISLFSIGRKLKIFKVTDSMLGKRGRTNLNDCTERLLIERSLSFTEPHCWAKTFMQKKIADADCELSELGKQVYSESQADYKKAQENEFDPEEVSLIIVSHEFYDITQLCGIIYVSVAEVLFNMHERHLIFCVLECLVGHGLLKDQIAEHLIVENEENIDDTLLWDIVEHPAELDLAEK